MANHCWNDVKIEGSPEVLDQLEVLFDNYKNTDYFVDFGNAFFPDMTDPPTKEDYTYYGTKWWEFTMTRTDANTLDISGDSAWSPPLKLIRMISETYDVFSEISFSEGGCNFAGVHSFNEDGIVDQYDCSCAQLEYNNNGMDGVIESYLSDGDAYDYYDSPADFIDKLDLEEVSAESFKILEDDFREHKIRIFSDDEVLEKLKGILKDVKNLGMNGLASRIEELNASFTAKLEKTD
jgi:hypothetical protein